MATEAEIVDAKIKLKEANDVVKSIVDRYVRNSMAGIAGEKNEYVLSDMLLRGKINVSEIGDEFDLGRSDESANGDEFDLGRSDENANGEEVDLSHGDKREIVGEMGVAQRNENAQGNELGTAQQGENEVAGERGEVQQNSRLADSGVRFNEFGEIVRDENAAETVRDVSGAEAGLDISTFEPPAMDDEIPTFTPPAMNDEIPTFTPPEKQADESQAESGMVTNVDTELENALTSVFDKDKIEARQGDVGAAGVVNGAQDDDFMAQIRAMQNQMQAEKEGAAAVDVADNTYGNAMGQADFTPSESQAENGAGNGVENVDGNVNGLGADNGNGAKVEGSEAIEADKNKEFKPIDFSFEDENEVAAEAENEKQAELSAEAASGRVDNLSDDALERLKASLKVAGEEERER